MKRRNDGRWAKASVACAFVVALAAATLIPKTSHLQEEPPAKAAKSAKGTAGESGEAAAGTEASTGARAGAEAGETPTKGAHGAGEAKEAGAGEHGAHPDNAAAAAAAQSAAVIAAPLVKEGCPLCPVSSKEEAQVLMQLRERHTLLAARENIVAQKEAALAKLEDTLDSQLTRLDVAMAKMEARLNVGEAAKAKRDAQLAALVQTLQVLSAKKAAPMLAEASPDFVAEIFRQLGPTRTASLLAVMPAGKAGKLIDLAVDAKVVPQKKQATKPATTPPAAAPPPSTPDAASAADKPGEQK